MKIITISREFGSGGRELGKRLSDALNVPCYDDEIIELIAERQGLAKEYVARMSERDMRNLYPSTIGRRFTGFPFHAQAITQQIIQITAEQHNVIRELAGKGNCVVVGRCADVILHTLNPLNLFVYASQESKLARCKSRATEDEHYTDREIVQMMRRIDKERAAYREVIADSEWGHKETYHLCINTSDKEIKKLIPGLTAYVKCWFGE